MKRTLAYQVISSSVFMACVTLLVICCVLERTQAAPYQGFYSLKRSKRHLIDIQNPKELIKVLDQLTQDIVDSDVDRMPAYDKRGIDLGLSRGFSGSQAAKHLLGMSAASLAHGPGRKRRSVSPQGLIYDREDTN